MYLPMFGVLSLMNVYARPTGAAELDHPVVYLSLSVLALLSHVTGSFLAERSEPFWLTYV
jgi:hypothetical protein